MTVERLMASERLTAGERSSSRGNFVMLLELRRHKCASLGDGVAPFAKLKRERMPNVRQARPHFELDGDVRFPGPSGQAYGVIQQNLRRSYLDQQRRQPGEIAVERGSQRGLRRSAVQIKPSHGEQAFPVERRILCRLG